eukprot:gene5645-8609_t
MAKLGVSLGRSFVSRGEGTLSIPFAMHKDHRRRLCEKLKGKVAAGSIVVVKGGEEQPVYDTDTAWDYKQESNYQWLFGAKETFLYGAIEVDTGKSFMFVPSQPDHYAMWLGPIRSPDWFKDMYEVDAVHYNGDISKVLKPLISGKLLVLDGVNHDSHAKPFAVEFEGIEGFPVEKSAVLYDAINECRVIKDEQEIKIMQFTNDVSSFAHIETMRQSQRSDRRMEYHSEAEFKYQSFVRGCSRVGYCCICPGEERNATLHYGTPEHPNEYEVKPGDLKLHDMGAEYHGYTADVTVTFPIGGKFSKEQKIVYDAVWKATVICEKAVKPGVNMVDLQRLAHRVLLEEMKNAGLFTGDVDEMAKADLMDYFMPTGLGHQLGLDVHDVGGYLPGEGKHILKQLTPPINQNLRLGRPLQEHMVFTIEPGFYFNAWKLSKLMEKPELVKMVDLEKLALFRPVGGVRIEDNVVVTATGCRILTNVPRTTEEVEAVIAGKEWKDVPLRDYSNA